MIMETDRPWIRFATCLECIRAQVVYSGISGHLAGIKDIVGFHGSTVDELENAFHETVDNYLAICEQTGRPAQTPYSGKLMLRVSPDAHAAVATTAAAHGKSINQWAAEVLTRAAKC
jgi:predicted HicB family RNase H-like nuclease